MKKLLLFFSLISLLISCSSESEETPELRDITFSFSELNRGSLSSSNSNNLTSNSNLLSAQNSSALTSNEDPFAILITIINSNNEIVINNQLLTLFRFGNDEFVTEAIGLEAGEYEITLFSVINSENRIIYATPVQGSLLAQLVDTPLNIPFSVTNNNTTLVTPDVITVLDTDSPEQFGFVTFSFNVVGNQTVTATFAAEILNGDAEMFIWRNGDDQMGQTTTEIDPDRFDGSAWDNDQDNADAFNLTPSSTVKTNDFVVADSPFTWNNGALLDWIDANVCDNSNQSGITRNDQLSGRYGFVLDDLSRRMYQPFAVEIGVEYTINFSVQIETTNSTFSVRMLTSAIEDELDLDGNSETLTFDSGTGPSFDVVGGDDTHQAQSFTFVATTNEVIFYGIPFTTVTGPSLDINCSFDDDEIFIDDIEIITPGF